MAKVARTGAEKRRTKPNLFFYVDSPEQAVPVLMLCAVTPRAVRCFYVPSESRLGAADDVQRTAEIAQAWLFQNGVERLTFKTIHMGPDQRLEGIVSKLAADAERAGLVFRGPADGEA